MFHRRLFLAAMAVTATLTLAACDGQPLDVELPPGALCDAVPITAEHRIEPGHYQIDIEAGNGRMGGLCPVSDGSIRRGRDALFGFTAPHSGRYHFRKRGTATMVSLHAGCDRDVEPLACAPSPHYHDLGLGSNPLGVDYALMAGESVLIQVDGYGGIDWPERLGLTIFGPAGAGGTCDAQICDAEGYCHFAVCSEDTQCHEGTCQIPPPPGVEGDPCDGLARCGADLYCDREGSCAVPPAPVLLDGWAHEREGVVHVQMTVDDPALLIRTGRIRIGETIGGRSSWRLPLTYTFSHPITPAPRQVALVDDAGRVWFELPVQAQPVLEPNAACEPRSEAGRCPVGTVCAGELEPRCAPVEVDALTHPLFPGEVAIILRGEDLGGLDTVYAPGSVWRAALDARRWVGRGAAAGDTVDVRAGDGGHLIAEAVPVRAAPLLDDGEACDAALAENRCAEGSACIHAVCVPSTPPVIDEAFIIRARGGYAIQVRGRDSERNVVGFRVGRHARSFVYGDWEVGDAVRPWGARSIINDGEAFEAWFSDATWTPFDAQVVVIDDQGLESAPFELEVVRPGEADAVGDGEHCDPLGLLRPCEADRICDQIDGVDETPRCVALDPVCPAELAPALAPDAVFEFEEAGAERDTRVTCRGSDQDIPQHYFRFVPPEDGRYHILAESEIGGWLYGMAVREGCLQRRSERICNAEIYRTNPAGRGGHGSGVNLTFDALAGEELTVVIDGHGPGFVEISSR